MSPIVSSSGRHVRGQRALSDRDRSRTMGRSWLTSSRASAGRIIGESAGLGQRSHHHRERLGLPPLPAPQLADRAPHWSRRTPGGSRRSPGARGFSPSRAGAAASVQRDFAAASSPQRRRAPARTRGAGRTPGSCWSRSDGAGRPGVEYSAGAGRALGESPHRRALPVVGQRLDDGEARAAVGAGDERIAVAPVAGVGQLPLAGRAQGHVGRDRLAATGLVVAGEDGEVGRPSSRPPGATAIRSMRASGGASRCGAPPENAPGLLRLPFEGDLDLAGRVADPAPQVRGAAPAGARRGESPPPAPRRSRAAAARGAAPGGFASGRDRNAGPAAAGSRTTASIPSPVRRR